MQISLLSRIQGALVGGAVADTLGACRQQAGGKFPFDYGADGAVWRLPPLSAAASIPWGRQWVKAVDVWLKSGGQSWGHLGQADQLIQFEDPAASAIALLPLIIITHTDPVQQQFALTSAVTDADWDFTRWLAALIGAAFINLALQNRLTPVSLIERLSLQIKELDLSVNNLHISGHLFQPDVSLEALRLLETIHRLIHQPDGLALAVEELQETSTSFRALGLALYCFLTSPEEPRLTIMRALSCEYSPQLTATLTGILTGAYNGLGGIPINWRSGLHQTQAGQTAISMLWRLPAEQSLRQLSEVLLAAWSGVDIGLIQSMPYSHVADRVESGVFEGGSL